MPANPTAGIGAQRHSRFLNSDAGQPMRNFQQTLSDYYKNKGKTQNATTVATHKFGTSAHNFSDALKAFKSGQQLDLSGANKFQKAELNRRYLESLRQKPTSGGRSAYDIAKEGVSLSYSYGGMPNTRVSSVLDTVSGTSTFSSLPTMR